MSATPPAIAAFDASGVEIEYIIVSHDSLDVMPAAGAALAALAQHGDPNEPPPDVILGDFGWSHELACHLLELKNPQPVRALGELARGLPAHVERMNELLRSMGARLMPGGMHPWMNPANETVLWPHQHDAAIYAAYDRIFNCRFPAYGTVVRNARFLSFLPAR